MEKLKIRINNFRNNYFRLDEDTMFRYKVLDLFSERFHSVIFDAKNGGNIVTEEVGQQSAMFLPELATHFEVNEDYAIKHISVLIDNKELKYIDKVGFIIDNSGFPAAANKKYFKEAEDLLWKKRERALIEDMQQMENKITLLQTNLFRLQNEMEAIKHSPTIQKTK